jgi:pilus assembly protein CpaB
MKSRGLVVVLALVLATLATAGVFLYMQGVREDAKTGGDLVTVVVSKVDIPANTELNPLIANDQFVAQEVPADAVVDGAITQLDELKGRKTNTFILAGEQIPRSRVEGGGVAGGVLGIPEGHQAITVALEAPRAISGALTGGDRVTIYATFEDLTIIKLNPDFTPVPTTGGDSGEGFDTTVVLVPEAEVLRVTIPQTSDVPGEEAAAPGTNVDMAITLAFLPDEAQEFVFALEEGKVYLSLLPPDGVGQAMDPLTAAQILSPKKNKA